MKKVEIILMHIKEDCTDIKDFIKNVDKEQFLENVLIKKAVCMSLINIGELVKALPKEFCDKHHNEVLKDIAIGEPVFLTKNGRGRFAIF